MASNGEPLTARTAAETIGRLEGVHAALERRTSGLTWMVWGVVGPAIFLSYGFAGAAGLFETTAMTWWLAFLWVPWVAMGVGITRVLWASAGLVIPVDNREGRKGGLITMALFIGLIFLGFAARETLDLQFHESAMVLAMLGLASLAIGAFGVLCTDRTERRLWLGVGGLLIVTAFAIAAIFDADQHSAVVTSAAAASALAWFVPGLYLATRS